MEDIQDVLTHHYDQLRSMVDEFLRKYNIPASVHAIHFNEHPVLPFTHVDNIDGNGADHPECETECNRNADGQWECRCKKPQ